MVTGKPPSEGLDRLYMPVYGTTASTKPAKKHVIILRWLDGKGNSLSIRSMCLCQIKAAHSFEPWLMQSSHVSIVKACVWLLKEGNKQPHTTSIFSSQTGRETARIATRANNEKLDRSRKSLRKGWCTYAERLHFENKTNKL